MDCPCMMRMKSDGYATAAARRIHHRRCLTCWQSCSREVYFFQVKILGVIVVQLLAQVVLHCVEYYAIWVSPVSVELHLWCAAINLKHV